MEKSDLVKVIEAGIALEKKGLINYLNFAHKSKSMTGKNMFIRLAKDEYDHMNILEGIKANIVEGKVMEKPQIPTEEIETLLPKIKSKDGLIKGEEGASDIEALKMALEFEKKAANYFAELAEKAEDEETKKLARELARWEETHYDLIQAEIDSITNTGFYFGVKEFEMSERF